MPLTASLPASLPTQPKGGAPDLVGHWATKKAETETALKMVATYKDLGDLAEEGRQGAGGLGCTTATAVCTNTAPSASALAHGDVSPQVGCCRNLSVSSWQLAVGGPLRLANATPTPSTTTALPQAAQPAHG